MKKLLSIVAIAMVFASCSNKANDDAKFEAARQVALKEVRDSLRIDSFKKADIVQKEKIQRLAVQKEVAEEKRMLLLSQQREARAPAATANTATSNTSSNKKQGWSQAAKGSVIGGAAGAVGGALIDKKKGRGAVIGGVVGAGTGYIIGRGQDKKSGRVQ